MRDDLPNTEDPDIELLSVDPDAAATVETVGSGSSSRVGTVVAVAVAIVAAVLVIGVGNSSDDVPGSAVTIQEADSQEADADDAPLTPTRLEPEPPAGVILGDGPGLIWQPVDLDVALLSWQGTGDGFVADDGPSEWRIGLEGSNPVASVGPSLLAGRPDYELSRIDGGQLLVPSGPEPDHLLVARGDDDPIRIELPAVAEPPESNVFETYVWVSGQLIGDRLVATVKVQTSINIAEIETRTGLDLSNVVFAAASRGQIEFFPGTPRPGAAPDPISLEEASFSDAEIAASETLNEPISQVLTMDLVTGQTGPVDVPDLGYVNDLVLRPDGSLLLVWDDTNGSSFLSTTLDGVTWSTVPHGIQRWSTNSGTQLFDFSTSASISRSTDGGETWESTRSPRREAQVVFAGDVIAQGRSWNSYDPSSGSSRGLVIDTNTDDYRLSLFESNQRFELRGLSAFDIPLLSGWIGDPSSGAEWDWERSELVFTDPASDEELLRVPHEAIRVADAAQNPMESIGFARWPAGVDDPDWLLTSPQAVFGEDALQVDFIGSSTLILAIVITTDGYEFFVADTVLP